MTKAHMDLETLEWDAAGLVTVVVQDRHTGEVRMLAHANRDAVARTLATGEGHFWSRSRQSLWRKGESSGNTLAVLEVWADCDGDALVYLVDATGPSCHTGRRACFYRHLDAAGVAHEPAGLDASPTLVRLADTLAARQGEDGDKSYTRSLLDEGAPKIGDKLREEAGELADAIADESDERVVSEAADVLYHLMVGLLHRGVSHRAVEAELARRFGVSGHDEKASR